MQSLLAGNENTRSRPWLAAQMPAFPHHALILSQSLAAEHGISPREYKGPLREPDLGSALLGERLTQKIDGLDCRQCHAMGGEVLKMENKAQGIGLSLIAPRLRREYYDRWMRDPLRIDPSSKMPRLTPDGQRTAATAILEGDASRQFEALWQYLHTIAADRD